MRLDWMASNRLKMNPTGPVTLKICTGLIRFGQGPLDGEVKLKNADNAVTGHYTAPPTSPQTHVLVAPFDRQRH